MACEKRRGGGETKVTHWWWNEEVKEAVSRREDSHMAMCRSVTEQNSNRYQSMNNKGN